MPFARSYTTYGAISGYGGTCGGWRVCQRKEKLVRGDAMGAARHEMVEFIMSENQIFFGAEITSLSPVLLR